MAKRVYVGVDGAARKVKKMYLGVSDVAHKVKKGYIGIGGVARPFFTGGEVAYFGAITGLRTARTAHAATSVGDYALFGGGGTAYGGDTPTNTVDAYNKKLTRSAPTALSRARASLAASSIGDYALFAGGNKSYGTEYNTIDVYDPSLTRTTPTTLSAPRYGVLAASTPRHALFVGGSTYNYDAEGAWYRSVVDAYDASLTRTITSTGSATPTGSCGACVGDYAIFMGGGSMNLTAFDLSLTRTQKYLSPARSPFAGASIERYAIFAGGVNGAVFYDYADAYDASLVRTGLAPLSVARTNLSGVGHGNCAIFAGGAEDNNSSTPPLSTVDVYDENLTRTTSAPLSVGRDGVKATTVGEYALFGGGREKSTTSAVVDAYVAG